VSLKTEALAGGNRDAYLRSPRPPDPLAVSVGRTAEDATLRGFGTE